MSSPTTSNCVRTARTHSSKVIIERQSKCSDHQAEKYITDAQGEADRFFNADFYFDPKNNKARETDFAEQKKRVNDDWDALRLILPR